MCRIFTYSMIQTNKRTETSSDRHNIAQRAISDRLFGPQCNAPHLCDLYSRREAHGCKLQSTICANWVVT